MSKLDNKMYPMDGEWQPIETAPRDGTPVKLGWLMGDIVEWEVTASWRFDAWRDPIGDDRGHFHDPADWQPLPDPPESTP